jgi:hypothetical protein
MINDEIYYKATETAIRKFRDDGKKNEVSALRVSPTKDGAIVTLTTRKPSGGLQVFEYEWTSEANTAKLTEEKT